MMASGIACAAPAAESGTGTWRCGNTYTDQPCKGGQAVDLDDTRDDARDASRKREADATTRDAQRTADRMERDRLRQESALAQRKAIVMEDRREPAARPDSRAAGRKKGKGRKEAEPFSAHDPVATARKKEEKAAKTGKRKAAGS
jgi:hypothetical protein